MCGSNAYFQTGFQNKLKQLSLLSREHESAHFSPTPCQS